MEKSNFDKVREFHETYGQEVLHTAKFPSEKTQQMRVDLIAEELDELRAAIADQNIIEVADALTDLLYVVYGAGHAFGIDLDETFNEVHRSNMSKLGEDGKPIRREDGKVLKGPNYTPPDLKTVLMTMGAKL